ncbi:hypothetical protein PM03_11800 [Thalassobacter stenotrophicus]|nr:hypothetical protein PM03_11800 [Thalassobacter stenotrophicus]
MIVVYWAGLFASSAMAYADVMLQRSSIKDIVYSQETMGRYGCIYGYDRWIYCKDFRQQDKLN